MNNSGNREETPGQPITHFVCQASGLPAAAPRITREPAAETKGLSTVDEMHHQTMFTTVTMPQSTMPQKDTEQGTKAATKGVRKDKLGYFKGW